MILFDFLLFMQSSLFRHLNLLEGLVRFKHMDCLMVLKDNHSRAWSGSCSLRQRNKVNGKKVKEEDEGTIRMPGQRQLHRDCVWLCLTRLHSHSEGALSTSSFTALIWNISRKIFIIWISAVSRWLRCHWVRSATWRYNAAYVLCINVSCRSGWTLGMSMSGKWAFVWTAVSSQSSMSYKALWEGDYLWPHLAPSLVI